MAGSGPSPSRPTTTRLRCTSTRMSSPLLEKAAAEEEPDTVAEDNVYSSRDNRAHLRKRRIKAVIREKKDAATNRKKKGSSGGRPVRGADADGIPGRNSLTVLGNRHGFTATT
ncbi:hypothetical protein RM844_12030 [Streptomyces sp. DSM 44915]|uniref:Transposase n=1 Tax=Streptomyces chisholmiae TaxID=3075540 RepID=A0ABU2JPV3_9ACTN|nr:hypothetical protein [Streptomyces sp. DSM 44915]MDT0267017.1 hypothetical protein [Streptomyces sp. DSM 44915]